MRLNALFRLAFATATPHGLTSPHTVTRRLILQKARGHITPPRGRNAPTACRHTVSGTISRPLGGVLFTSPSRYWFPIGHQGVFRLRGWSPRIHTEFHGLRATWEHARESSRFRVRGYHPLCRRFPAPSATQTICNSLPGRQSRPGGPSTPVAQRLPAITRNRFGLFPFRSPLLRESRLLSLPAGTEMFHFPALPHPALCVQAGATGNYACRVSPFGHPRITVWLPTPRGLSQAPTSFIGSWCQGIHRAPLKTWQHSLQMHYKTALSAVYLQKKMLASTVQFSRYGRHKAPPPRLRRKGLALAEVPGLCPHDAVLTQAGFLRTQQRAHPAALPGSSFRATRARRGTYWPRPCAAAR